VSDLLSELRPEIEAAATPLFDASEIFVRKRGAFLPHGAIVEADGGIKLIAAAAGEDLDAKVSSVEVLPALHDALRAAARRQELRAVAVCEDVTITPAGQKPTKAIKVLVEHRRGLVVALYLPWKRRLIGGCAFGRVMAMPGVEPEVRPWGDVASA
jgi:hypothetical protein